MLEDTVMANHITENLKVSPGTLVTALIINKEGQLLHIALPPESKYNLGSEFNESLIKEQKAASAQDHNGETHAFIAKSCLFNEEPCELILISPKIGHTSNHATLGQAINRCSRQIKNLTFPEAKEETSYNYKFSGECHATQSLAELKTTAENHEKLAGIRFILKGTATSNLYRTQEDQLPKLVLTDEIVSARDAERESKPALETGIPIELMTLDRKQYDSGIKFTNLGESGIAETPNLTPSNPTPPSHRALQSFFARRSSNPDNNSENKKDDTLDPSTPKLG